MIHVAQRFYLFGTGGLLGVRSSTNLATVDERGHDLQRAPGAGSRPRSARPSADLWAPDVSYVNGTYRVYYAGSTFGSNHSVIGLATNTTLDPKNSAYEWLDQGLVHRIQRAGSKDDWNAIDPNATTDAAGNWWLVFGSFWSGIKLRRLDTATGKLSTADTTLYALGRALRRHRSAVDHLAQRLLLPVRVLRRVLQRRRQHLSDHGRSGLCDHRSVHGCQWQSHASGQRRSSSSPKTGATSVPVVAARFATATILLRLPLLRRSDERRVPAHAAADRVAERLARTWQRRSGSEPKALAPNAVRKCPEFSAHFGM